MSFAVSADGCLSAKQGAASRVSSDEALRMTHELRAVHDALLVGVGTVLSDDPLLTTRLAPGPSPRRVVLDTRLRVPAGAKLLSATPTPAVLMTTAAATAEREQVLASAGAEVVRVDAGPGGVDLTAALGALHARGVRSLMVEGGAAVLESFCRARLIDFCAVTLSPQRLGLPGAVHLGPAARALLATWDARGEPLGVDLLRSGAAP